MLTAILIGGLACGCGGEKSGEPAPDGTARKSGTMRLSSKDQALFDFCYLILRPETREGLKLSGVQRVRLAVYNNRLKGILTYYTAGSSKSESLIVAGLNDLSQKIPRTLELASQMRAALNPQQIEAFEQARKKLKLRPIKPLLGDPNYSLQYSLSGDESYLEVELKSGKKAKVITLASSDSVLWPDWLESGPDLVAALQSDERELRMTGIRRALTYPTSELGEADADKVVAALLLQAKEGNAPGISRRDVLAALARFARPVHRDALLELAVGARGGELTGIVAGLLRVAPDAVLPLALSRSDEFTRFSAVLKGFEMHGNSSADLLVQIDEKLEGKHRSWIQRTLDEMGSDRKLAARERFPKRTAPVQGTAPSGVAAPSHAGDPAAWLAAIQSDDMMSLSKSFKQPPADLKNLPPALRKQLAEICAARLRQPNFASFAREYGALLMEVVDRESLEVFKKLCQSDQRPARRYGLAGMMRISSTEAIPVIVGYEKIRMGMHDVTAAAALAGKAAIPALRAAGPRLEKRISQMSVEGQLKKLESL